LSYRLNGLDGAFDITLDAAGYAYVTGSNEQSSGNADYATIKYNPHGTELWLARYKGPGSGDDRAASVALGADGYVYVTGSSEQNLGNADCTTIKYDTDGTELWVIRYNGPGDDDDRALRVALDPAGNVYVTGSSEGDQTALRTLLRSSMEKIRRTR
jgi:hypothetical protein